VCPSGEVVDGCRLAAHSSFAATHSHSSSCATHTTPTSPLLHAARLPAHEQRLPWHQSQAHLTCPPIGATLDPSNDLRPTTHRVPLLRAAQLPVLEQRVLWGHHHVGDAKQGVGPRGEGGEGGALWQAGPAAPPQAKGDVSALQGSTQVSPLAVGRGPQDSGRSH